MVGVADADGVSLADAGDGWLLDAAADVVVLDAEVSLADVVAVSPVDVAAVVLVAEVSVVVGVVEAPASAAGVGGVSTVSIM